MKHDHVQNANVLIVKLGHFFIAYYTIALVTLRPGAKTVDDINFTGEFYPLYNEIQLAFSFASTRCLLFIISLPIVIQLSMRSLVM